MRLLDAAAACMLRRPRAAAALALASLLVAVPVPTTAQDAVGRLFFTPAQRQQLDEARRKPAAPEPVRDGSDAPKPLQTQSLSVEGIVRRSDGQATVWVNRAPTQAPQPSGAVRIGPVRDASDGADLRLPDNGRRVRIKVGQEVDVQSGRIQERYRLPPPQAPKPGSSQAKGPADDAAVPAPGNASRTEAPHTDVPRTDIPRTDAPRTDAPRADAPRDAAVERILRELGRRLDEPARAAEPAR